MALGNEIDALKAIEKEIGNIRAKLKGSHEDILMISKAARDAQGSFMDIKLPKELEKSLKSNQTFLNQLNAQLKERDRLEKALQTAVSRRAQAESNINKELLRNREETRLLNRAMKEEALLSSKLVSEYRKLEVKHSRVARTVRDLAVANKENTREYKRAVRELNKYRTQLDKADKATGNFRRNVGNYQSAFHGATTAFRTFSNIFGIYSGLQIAREIYGQITALDSLKLSLEQVSETVLDLNRNQQFLKETADISGVNIINLSQSYIKFLASAKTTNLTLEETELIFRNVSKAASLLGLRGDDINGVFRALEQILSKGKVQAEEIRGQLGERLPGAFQILAKSMGLTTQELSKQLELGNVLSEDVLPGFAKQLAETYSLEKVQRVENMAAQQERLGNAWTRFVDEVINKDNRVSTFFTGLLGVITDIFDKINDSFADSQDFIDEERAKSSANEMERLAKTAEEAGVSLREVADINFFSYTKSVEEARNELNNLLERRKELETQIANTPLSDGFTRGVLQKELRELNESIETSSRLLGTKQGKLDAVRRAMVESGKETNNLKNETDGLNGSLDKASRKLQEISTISFGTTIDEAKKLAKEAKSIADSLSGTLLGSFDSGLNAEDRGFLALFGGLRTDLENLPEEVQQRFKEIQEKLRKAREEFKKEATGKVGFGAEALGVPNPDEVSDALAEIVKKHADAQDSIVKKTKLSAEQQQAIFDQLFSTFSSYYGLDLTAFSKIAGGKKASLEDYANFAKSVSNLILENQLINYENEIVANQERLDIILADENATEEQKTQAKLEADRKEKEIRTKQAKAERTNAIIQIGIDTAVAFVKALPNLALAGVVAGLGAAQAAFVLAQPLPKFEDGVRDFDGGHAMINDQKGGRFKELVETPDGKFFMSNKRNVVADLPKGSNVYTADETQAILNGHQLSESERIDLAVMRMSFEMFENLEDKIENGIDKGFKKARITNNIKNVINQPTTKFF